MVASRIRVMEIDPGQVETEFSVVRFGGDREKAGKVYEGVEPLTPEDIAEVVVFAAGRRENVVLADTLIFPNHQVSGIFWGGKGRDEVDVLMKNRLLRRLCTARLLVSKLEDRLVHSDDLFATQKRHRSLEPGRCCRNAVLKVSLSVSILLIILASQSYYRFQIVISSGYSLFKCQFSLQKLHCFVLLRAS